MEKRIGKIQAISFGFGGYQDAQIGVSVMLGSDKDGWGVQDFKGHWAMEHEDRHKWTDQERNISLGETCMWLAEVLEHAKKSNISQLIGTPVEVIFDNMSMKSWRVLTEVI